MLTVGANLAFDTGFSATGDLVLALPFLLIGFYALVGVLRGGILRLAWFVQAILTLLAWQEMAGSSSSTAALVFGFPLFIGPAIATLLVVVAAASSGWRALRSLSGNEDGP